MPEKKTIDKLIGKLNENALFTGMVTLNYNNVIESMEPIPILKQAMTNLEDADFLSLCTFIAGNTLMLALILAQRFSSFVFSNTLNYAISVAWDDFDGLTGLYGAWKLYQNGETWLALVSTLNNLQLIATTIFSALFLGIINSPIVELSFETTMGILGAAFTLSVLIPIAMDYWAVEKCKQRIAVIKSNTADSNLSDDQKALIELENIQINFHHNNMKAWSVCAISMTIITVFTFIALSHLTLGGLPAAMLLGIAIAWIGSYLRGKWLSDQKTKDIEAVSGHDVHFLNEAPTDLSKYNNSYIYHNEALYYVNDYNDKQPINMGDLKDKIEKFHAQKNLLSFFKSDKLHLTPKEVNHLIKKNTTQNHQPTRKALDNISAPESKKTQP